MQQPPCFFLAHTQANGGQIFAGHQLTHGLVRIFGKAHIAVGHNPDQLSAFFDHGDARNRMGLHQRAGIGERGIGRDRNWINHHPRFKPLHLANRGALLFDRQIAVEHPYPAKLRHNDRHARLGNGIHRGGQDGYIQANRRRDECPCIGLARQYFGRGGLQQHIVEG